MICELPDELIIRILTFLSLSDVAICKRLSKQFNAIIAESVLIQYRCSLEEAGLQDNPCSPLTTQERLDLLKVREHAWSTFTPCSVSAITISHHTSGGIYDLAGGVYLSGEGNTGDANAKGLQYVRLPSLDASQQPQWESMVFNPNRDIIDFCSAMIEHDLIAVVVR